MQFTLVQITDTPPCNATAEIADSVNYPLLRTTTVGSHDHVAASPR